jgi:hypothetical protein
LHFHSPHPIFAAKRLSIMKKHLILFVAFLSVISIWAVDYNPTVDYIQSGHCYVQVNGDYFSASFNQNNLSWPASSKAVIIYGLHMPAGHVRADLIVLPKQGKTATLHMRLLDTERGITVASYDTTLVDTRARVDTIEIMPDVVLPEDRWYRMEISADGGYNAFTRLQGMLFQRESDDPVVDCASNMAQSVHLHSYSSTAPAPQGEAYDWMYLEVMYPSQYEAINTYVMSIGSDGQYGGIQSIRQGLTYKRPVLFSIWDHGDVDADPNLPDHLRSGALAVGPDVFTVRFGGEGTGVSARYPDGQWWMPDHWMQFLVFARPEAVEVEVKIDDGSVSTIVYENTLQTMWYKQDDADEWRYIATLRQSGINHLYNGMYSFIENWSHVGGEFYRRAYFRNPTFRSAASGKWYPRNKVAFGHTWNYDEPRRSRTDFGHGVTALYENTYYMETGGYYDTHDSASVLPMPQAPYLWVDTIDTQALRNQVDRAFRSAMSEEMTAQTASGSLSKVGAVVQHLLAEAGHFGSYAPADLEELRRVWADGSCTDVEQLKAALDRLTASAQPLRYGLVQNPEHHCSSNTYCLWNTSSSAVLAVEGGEVKAVANADVSALSSNWYVLRSEQRNEYYIWSPSARQFLNIDAGSITLSDLPQAFTLPRYSGGWLVGNTSSHLAVSADGALSVSDVSKSESVFQLRANYGLETPEKEIASLIEYAEQAADVEAALQMLCDDAMEVYARAFTLTAGANPLITSYTQFSSNVAANQQEGHGFATLIDGDATTWYESWYEDIQWPDAMSWLQVRLKADDVADRFWLDLTASDANDDVPVAITVWGGSTVSKLVRQCMLDDVLPEAAASARIPLLLSEPCRYLRFEVNGTKGNRDDGHRFALSELQLYSALPDAATSLYSLRPWVAEAADALQTAVSAARAALLAGTATTADVRSVSTAREAFEAALADDGTGLEPATDTLYDYPSGDGLLRDFSGRVILHPAPGIYIQAGKKIMIW